MIGLAKGKKHYDKRDDLKRRMRSAKLSVHSEIVKKHNWFFLQELTIETKLQKCYTEFTSE